MKDEFLINSLMNNPHAPSNLRANLVNNNKHFYSSFNVIEKDKMFLSPNIRINLF